VKLWYSSLIPGQPSQNMKTDCRYKAQKILSDKYKSVMSGTTNGSAALINRQGKNWERFYKHLEDFTTCSKLLSSKLVSLVSCWGTNLNNSYYKVQKEDKKIKNVIVERIYRKEDLYRKWWVREQKKKNLISKVKSELKGQVRRWRFTHTPERINHNNAI